MLLGNTLHILIPNTLQITQDVRILNWLHGHLELGNIHLSLAYGKVSKHIRFIPSLKPCSHHITIVEDMFTPMLFLQRKLSSNPRNLRI